MKMYVYTSIEPNEEEGMPEASLKIANFEIFKCTQIKLEHLISLHQFKKKTLNESGIHQTLGELFTNLSIPAILGH